MADRFHVTKIVNEDVNQVRRAVLKANENNPDPVEKVKVKEAFRDIFQTPKNWTEGTPD